MNIFAEVRCRESEIGTQYFKTDITEDDLKQLAIKKVSAENNVPCESHLEVGYLYKRSCLLMECTKCKSQEFGSGRTKDTVFCLKCHTEQKDFRIKRFSVIQKDNKELTTVEDKDGEYCKFVDHEEKYEILFRQFIAERDDNKNLEAERDENKDLIKRLVQESKQMETLLDTICTIYGEFLGTNFGEHSAKNNPWVNLANFPSDNDSYVFLQNCAEDKS
ncbi:MAG: hypothetical protein NE328_19140 [Lentisphaeraceae bacterium]|nr:hypothetical protein [Lentisphaeraceae bacterium]